MAKNAKYEARDVRQVREAETQQERRVVMVVIESQGTLYTGIHRYSSPGWSSFGMPVSKRKNKRTRQNKI